MSGHQDDIVCVARASTSAEAYIWKNALEGEGIECKVVGDMLEAGIADISGLQPELWVHRRDAENALRIINEKLPAGSGEGEEGEDEE